MFQKKSFKIIIASVVLIVILFLVGIIADKNKTFNEENKKIGETDIVVTLPEKTYVTNGAVIEWINGTESAKDIYDKYRQYGRLDYTKPVDILYSIDNIPFNYTIVNQYMTVVDKDYSKEVYFEEIPPDKRVASIENLRPDTVYEYHIQVKLSNGEIIEKRGDFKTEPTPCFLFVDGTRNVRDIGTTKTIDGKQIKKYMVYRGSELDGAIAQNYCLTEDGIQYMNDILKMKTEVDLRWYDEKTMKNVLGADVSHNYYTISSYSEIFDTSYSVENTKKLFSDLANPDTYPIYVHCSYGADRTGTVIYLLEALLGVSEENLYREWECSVICNGDSFYEEMDDFLIRFKQLPGNTMQEKAEKYLLSIGVTQREIDSIREILLTD